LHARRIVCHEAIGFPQLEALLAFAEARWPSSCRLLYQVSPRAVREKDLRDFRHSVALSAGGEVIAALADHIDPEFGRHGCLMGEPKAASELFRHCGSRSSRLVSDFEPDPEMLGIARDEVQEPQQLMRVCRETYVARDHRAACMLGPGERHLLPKEQRSRDWMACAYIEGGKPCSFAFAGHLIEGRGAFIRWVVTHEEHRGKGYATAVTSCLVDRLLKTYPEVLLYAALDGPAPHVYRKVGFQRVAIHYFVSRGP
jgi:ribosomal protein S18 acetylase RimI-like enzyme